MDLKKLIDKTVLSVAEMDDRTSPDYFPDALLITEEELRALLNGFYEEAMKLPEHDGKECRTCLHYALEEDGKITFSYSDETHDLTFTVKTGEPFVVVDVETTDLRPTIWRHTCSNCKHQDCPLHADPCRICHNSNEWVDKGA